MSLRTASGAPDSRPSIDVVQRGQSVSLKSSILIVDDNELNRTLLASILNSAGYVNVHSAEDGYEALDIIDEIHPRLLILDIMMPGIDGYEVTRRLRQLDAWRTLPILVQTALTTPEQRSKVFDSGVTDLVTKPVDAKELLARVQVHLDNQLLIEDLLTYRDRVDGELRLARSMYEHTLPTPYHISTVCKWYSLNIEFLNAAADELGGDVFGIHKVDSSRLLFFLVDIAGRGVSAAINAFRLHTLIQQTITEFSDPELLLEVLNSETVDFFAPGEFATAIFALVDSDRRQIRYASAGGCPPIVVTDGQAWTGDPTAGGPPLGIDERFNYRAVQLDFPTDSALVLYSNALETHRLNGQAFGPTGAAKMLAQAIKPGQKAKDAISAALSLDHNGRHDDDLTLIVIGNWPSEDDA